RGSERLGGERSAPSASADQTAQVSGPDLVVRLERLESQIRQLTGTIEQLQFRNQQLESQVRRMQEEGVPRPAGQSRGQNPSAPGAATPGRRGDAVDPTQNPNPPGAPYTLGAINCASATPGVRAHEDEQPIVPPRSRNA